MDPQASSRAFHVSPMPQVYMESKKVHVNASEVPFQKDEAYFSKASLIDELVKDRDGLPSRCATTKMGKLWETSLEA